MSAYNPTPSFNEHGETKPVVKLIGENGNVYNLLGLCQRAARKAGWSRERINEWRDSAMKSGSYDEVLQKIMRDFDVE